MKVQKFNNNDNKTPLRFSVKNENLETGDHKEYGFFTTTFEIMLKQGQTDPC